MAAEKANSVIHEFVAQVVAANPTHGSFLNASLATLQPADNADLLGYLTYCIDTGMSIAAVAESYNTIVRDTQAEQIHFLRNGSYRHRTFDQVADGVYFDPDYMQRYMCGLAISSFLWPNHNAMHHFFLDNFPAEANGTYVEIGPGHGYYFMKAAATGRFRRLVGIDISPTSIAMTWSILQHHGIEDAPEHRVELLKSDFLSQNMPLGEISMLVMGEVLEHVEQPRAFLTRLYDLANDDTTLYLTTCVNAPAIDHIYLFESTDEVQSMFEDAGLKVEKYLHVPYTGKTLEQCVRQRLAINVAYFLKKE